MQEEIKREEIGHQPKILPFNYPLILTSKHFELASLHPLKNKVQSLNSRHVHPPYPGHTYHIRYISENNLTLFNDSKIFDMYPKHKCVIYDKAPP
jgi:hypothetical protein